MEKLQKALTKARAERESYQSAVVHDESLPEGPSAVDDLWAELKPVDMSQRTLVRNRVVSHDQNRETGAFDILRTKVILQMRKNGWKRLAITSPTAACGKSTITCNLAMGLSRQADLRAIVLEMDLRRPSIANMLQLKPAGDISQVLSGSLGFAEQALRVRDNVALSLAAHSSPDPTRYMLSQATEDKLAELEELYQPDLMIVDTPPVMLSDDTRAFLGKVDCAMIVARAEKTTINQIDTCEREIAEHTNVLGVVLNQARFVDPDTGYGYGYGYEE